MRPTLPAALVLIAAWGGGASAAPPDVRHFTLPNGLEGYVIEDHRAPVVTSMIWYRVGSADEPPGMSGIAHFLEHLMFKATDELEDGEFSRIIAANGGDDNAFTSTDYTAYHQRIAADRLELVLAMEADRMVGLDPGAAGVLAERDVVRAERRQRVESDPGGPFSESRRAALYLNHPYGRPVIGWAHEIEAFTVEAALDFYRRHYAPNNAILVVAGDVEASEVERLAARHFGPIPASNAIAPRVRPQEPPHRAARRVELRDPRVAQPHVARSYLAPSRQPGDQRTAAALVLLEELLGGTGLTSVLGRGLIAGEEVALEVGASYSDVAVDPSSFGLSVVPKPGVSLAEAEAGLDMVLARFLAEGPDPAALARTKARIAAAEIYALDNQHGRARRLGAALATGLTLKDVEEWPGLLQEVTADEVVAAARAVLVPEASVTGWLLATEPAAAPAAPVGQ